MVILVSYVLSFALRFDAPSAEFVRELASNLWVIGILVPARVLAFIALHLYQRVWKYASTVELRAIIVATAIGSALAYGFVYAAFFALRDGELFPRSIVAIETVLSLLGLGGIRFSLGLLGIGRREGGRVTGAARTLIVGAGSAGVAVARELITNTSLGLNPVGFVDDAEPVGHRLLGLSVLSRIDSLATVVRDRGIGTVLIALPQADGRFIRQLARAAESVNARTLTIPSLAEVVAGKVEINAFREIALDDLIRRAPTNIDLEDLDRHFRGRRVLITGGGGSIGKELSLQLLRFEPNVLYVLGRGEYSVRDTVMAASGRRSGGTQVRPLIADVRDAPRIRRIFNEVHPEVVFHAAAHKHVDLMEEFPEEAVTVNVLGTHSVLSASAATGVGRFVFISSDKAVQPGSVMGATKRLSEIIVASFAARHKLAYCSVRFGNVLSSRGSVVPLFREQIERGGPVTITHPDMSRSPRQCSLCYKRAQ